MDWSAFNTILTNGASRFMDWPTNPYDEGVKTILFVCTGNTCRSPMAEAIARHLLGQSGEELFFASAGVAAIDGCPVSQDAQDQLTARGIPFEGHSKGLSADMVAKAALVLCMTPSHLEGVRALLGGDAAAMGKVHLLDADGGAIDDPIGRGPAAYAAVADTFERVIPDRVGALLGTPSH